jgi:hypothetical protein
MTEHTLKTLPPFWEAVRRGDKTFEVRYEDRGFKCGDLLILRLYPNDSGTNYDIRKRISCILTGGQHGIIPGYVVLALTDE